jgi:hypothetical protein
MQHRMVLIDELTKHVRVQRSNPTVGYVIVCIWNVVAWTSHSIDVREIWSLYSLLTRYKINIRNGGARRPVASGLRNETRQFVFSKRPLGPYTVVLLNLIGVWSRRRKKSGARWRWRSSDMWYCWVFEWNWDDKVLMNSPHCDWRREAAGWINRWESRREYYCLAEEH